MSENTSGNSWVKMALFLIIGLFIGIKSASFLQPQNKIITSNGKLEGVLQVIKQNYVDTINSVEIEDATLEAMLRNLDPHSVYIPTQYFKQAEEEIDGNFEGIGVQFRVIDDTVVVITPVSGGPSERVGIQAGDRIVQVDTICIAGKGLANDDIIKHLKGPKGSKVKLGLKRSQSTALIYVTVVRDVIPTYSVDVKFMVDSKLGYVKVSKFSRSTANEFASALSELEAKGMKSLIVDMRSNGGGLLGSCVEMADMFLEKGDLIVYTEGEHRARVSIKATGSGKYKDIPLVVLVDEWAASASEIFAGAMQDNDRATIVGRRTFGKGLVQEQMEMSDGSAIRLTVARYYTPSGRCIQKSYVAGKYEDYEEELLQRYISGEMTGIDTLNHGDTTVYYTVKKHRPVYGGGGIMPDIQVPYKTNSLYVYWNELSNKGMFYQFSFNYADGNRTSLKNKYPTVNKFISDFKIDEKMFSDFIKYSEQNGIKKNEKSIETYKERMKLTLKAYIGRDLYDDLGFYPVYLQTDEDFLKAKSVFN